MKSTQKKDERYDLETHYGFGENWAHYARTITESDIEHAKAALLKLLPASEWMGKDILDIGCGSGMPALAMLRLGAKSVICIDMDPQSIATTKSVLTHHAYEKNWEAKTLNILSDQSSYLSGKSFDVVYSWGVLHHTGALNDSILRASQFVKSGGKLVLALYKKTPLCGFWKIEKRTYNLSPKIIRSVLDGIYYALYALTYTMVKGSFRQYVKDYPKKRGMHFMTDVRDWLGGYPYESISPQKLEVQMAKHGFIMEKSMGTHTPRAMGLFGSGCAEYVFLKMD